MPPNVHRLEILLGTLLVALCCWQVIGPTAYAQLPDPLQVVKPQQATPQEKSERALKPWQAEVKQRLEQIEQRIAAQESDEESQVSAELKRQQELLSWLALSLSQLEAERNKSQQLESYLEGEQEALDKFLQAGFDASEPATFLRLDEARDELLSEQRRLARLREKSKAATAAWEHARQELKERSSARRLALEAFETNRDDA